MLQLEIYFGSKTRVFTLCDNFGGQCIIQKNNKYLELSAAMRNLWCLEKISILPLIISAKGIVPQSLFKNSVFREHIGS
jgi:hypothetical protein